MVSRPSRVTAHAEGSGRQTPVARRKPALEQQTSCTFDDELNETLNDAVAFGTVRGTGDLA